MRSKLSIRRKISVFSIDYDIQSKPLANIDMIAVIFHPLGLNPFVRCAMSELYNHFSAEKVVRVSYVRIPALSIYFEKRNFIVQDSLHSY